MRFVNDRDLRAAIAGKRKAKETATETQEPVATAGKKPDAVGQKKEEKQDGSH